MVRYKSHREDIMTDVSTYKKSADGAYDLDPYFAIISEEKAIQESCLRAFEQPLREALNDHDVSAEVLAAKLAYEALSDERVAVCDVTVTKQRNTWFFKASVTSSESVSWEFSGSLGADMILKITEAE